MLEDAVVQHRACSSVRIAPQHHGRIPGHFVHAHDHTGQEQVALDVVQVLETEFLPNGLKAADTVQLLNSLEGTRLDNFRSHALRDTRIEGVNEVTRNATVVLRRDPNTGTGTVLYYRVL